MGRYIDIEPYEKDGWYLQKHYHNSYGEVIKTTPLISVPTAEVKPIKHGRWICLRDGDNIGLYECSECHKRDIHAKGCNISYCWNCGAKMDLDEVRE